MDSSRTWTSGSSAILQSLYSIISTLDRYVGYPRYSQSTFHDLCMDHRWREIFRWNHFLTATRISASVYRICGSRCWRKTSIFWCVFSLHLSISLSSLVYVFFHQAWWISQDTCSFRRHSDLESLLHRLQSPASLLRSVSLPSCLSSGGRTYISSGLSRVQRSSDVCKVFILFSFFFEVNFQCLLE